jgi:hypothetical protein
MESNKTNKTNVGPAEGPGALGARLATEAAPVEIITLNSSLADVVEDLAKVANCDPNTGLYCNIPYKLVIRRGSVDFVVKRGKISIRKGVVTVETDRHDLIVDADFGTISLILNKTFLLKTGKKLTWDGTELVLTATEFVELVKENIREIIRREGL